MCVCVSRVLKGAGHVQHISAIGWACAVDKVGGCMAARQRECVCVAVCC